MQVYGERGWYGLTFDEVARRAKVGKALLYSRWSSLEDLLPAAFRQLLPAVGPAQADIRDELIAEARRAAKLFLGPHRLAVFRLSIEGLVGPPVLSDLLEEMQNGTLEVVRRRVTRAIADGQLPATTSAEFIVDQITGTVLLHARSCPQDQLDEARAAVGAYAEGLADWILAQARASGRPAAPQAPTSITEATDTSPFSRTHGNHASTP